MNVFDSKAGGAMVVAALPEGRPLWVEQIRNNFLHPTSESLATYANIVLGEDGEDDIDNHIDVDPAPTQGEGETTEQVETRKKRKKDKTEEKKAEEPVAKKPRKHPSNSSFLDSVTVSDSLSILNTGVKRSEHDHNDDAMLTEIMKKRKALEDKKKELDAQVTAAMAKKKSKLQKETAAAPSESEVDLGVFSAKVGNLLEKMFKSAFGSRAPKSGRSTRKIDISKITPPTSPPPRPLDLSPPHPDPKGKGKEDEVEADQTEKVVESVAVGAGKGDVRADDAETEGGASGTRQSLEFQHVQGGSWTTHNPACDDLPHAPHWTLTQGSRMNDLSNCREFYSLSLQPAERMFQKNRHRMDLLDDHIHAGVNFYATCQEIVREWQLMGEDTLEFEAAKKELAEEREKFNAKKKGLAWRVADAKDKLAKEK
ncbi:hypothetical protein HanPI659440_Chr16g0627981 [Helianthus annuus]|nr:hypothetical protein HanPI659440_Chr16g0627981 [Helianthus annuus]